MKFRRILSGVLTAAMVVTSLPVSGFGSAVAQASDPSVSYVHRKMTADDSWTVTTDAGTSSGNIENVVKDDNATAWASAEGGTNPGDTARPLQDMTFVENNHIYITLPEAKTVSKMVYVADHGSLGAANGRIKQANVYFATTDKPSEEELETNPEKMDEWKATWKKVVADTEDYNYTDIFTVTTDNDMSRRTYDFTNLEGDLAEANKNVKCVIIEALRTDQYSADSYISGHDLSLYETSDDGSKITGLTAEAEATAQPDNEIENLVDTDADYLTSRFHSIWNNNTVGQEGGSIVPIRAGFTARNNIYITLPQPQYLSMLTYMAGNVDGSIRRAKIYLSDEDVTEAQSVQDWGTPVYDGSSVWYRYDNTDSISDSYSAKWTPRPQPVKHVRIEVLQTYGNKFENQNNKINVKNIALYRALQSDNVALGESAGGKTKIAAYSGHEQSGYAGGSSSNGNIDHINDGVNNGNDDWLRWAAGPQMKQGGDGGAAIPDAKTYVVLDLGKNTKTVIDKIAIRWHNLAWATHYKIETSDTCEVESVNKTESPFTDKRFQGGTIPEDWDLITEVNSEDGTGKAPEDDEIYAGVRDDNPYFETGSELKRYVRIVADDMNSKAAGTVISVREWEIYGVRRYTKVDLTATAPVKGNAPADVQKKDEDEQNPTYYDVTTKWTDVDAPAEAVTQFKPGCTYKVTATVTPDDGFRFLNDTAVTLENATGGSGEVEKKINDDGTMEVSYTFAALPDENIESAGLTITPPAAGEEKADVTSTDVDAHYTIATKWTDTAAEEEDVTTFKAGKTYKVTATLTANKGYVFKDGFAAADVTLTEAEGVTDGSETVNLDGGKKTVTVEYTFDALPKTSISSVALTVTPPAVHETPADAATEESGYSATTKWEDTSASGQPVTAFKPKKTYKVTVTLTPDEEHVFSEATTATLTGAGDGTTSVNKNYSEPTLTLDYTFAELPTYTIPAVTLNVTAPKTGATKADATADAAQTEWYDVTTEWTKGEGEAVDSAFEDDTDYTVKATLTAKDGYEFSADTTAQFKDNTVTYNVTEKTFNDGEKNKLVVSYTFEAQDKEALEAAELALRQLLNDCTETNESGQYTKASWEAFAAVKEGAEVLATASESEAYVTVESLTQAKSALEEARKGLKVKLVPILRVEEPQHGETWTDVITSAGTGDSFVWADSTTDPAFLTTSDDFTMAEDVTENVVAFKGAMEASMVNEEQNSKFNLTGSTPFLISFKMKVQKPTASGADKWAIIGRTRGQYGLQMSCDDSGKYYLNLGGQMAGGENAGAYQRYEIKETFWNEWHRVIAMFDGGKFHIYVDGVEGQINTSNSGSFTFQENTDVPFTIGRGYTSAGVIDPTIKQYPGLMADVQMYKGEQVPTLAESDTYNTLEKDLIEKSPMFNLVLSKEGASTDYTVETKWYKGDSSDALAKDTHFEAGTYKVSAVLTAKDGYAFDYEDEASLPQTIQVLSGIESSEKEVTVSGGKDDPSTMTVSATFEVRDPRDVALERLKNILDGAPTNNDDGIYTTESYNLFVASQNTAVEIYNDAIKPDSSATAEDINIIADALLVAISELEAAPHVSRRLTPDKDTWKVDTDAGEEGANVKENVLDDDDVTDMWKSKNVNEADGPTEDTTLVKNNHIYLTLTEAADLQKLVYVTVPNNEDPKVTEGRITQARIWTATSENADPSEWKLVSEDAGLYPYVNGQPEREFLFDTAGENHKAVKQVIVEVLHTDGDPIDRCISGLEMELYDTDGQKISGLTATADATAQEEMPVSKLVDGDKVANGGFHTATEDQTAESVVRPARRGMYANNNFYISIPEAKVLSMITYVAGSEEGAIRNAKIYVSNETLTEGKTVKEITDWTEVYDGTADWSRYVEGDDVNNAANISFTPKKAQHVRIEVQRTWGETFKGRDEYINAKQFILYESVEAEDVALPSKGVKVVAYSGHENANFATPNGGGRVEKIINGTKTSGADNERWAAGPYMKGSSAGTNPITYVVLDLGPNSRTVLSSMSIKWHNLAWATHYLIQTSDSLTVDQCDSNQASNWTDSTLAGVTMEKDPEKNGGWDLIYEGTNESGNTGTYPEDWEEFEGVRDENPYFETGSELKRYVRLVIDGMNTAASGDVISIREWQIYGVRRIEPATSCTCSIGRISFDDTTIKMTAENMEYTPSPTVELGGSCEEQGHALKFQYEVLDGEAATVSEDGSKLIVSKEGTVTVRTTVTAGLATPQRKTVTFTVVDDRADDSDVEDLNAAIQAAKEFKNRKTESDYTADSWKALTDAIAQAETAAAEKPASKEHIDAAKAALEAAKSGLKEKWSDAEAKFGEQSQAYEGKEADNYTADSWKAAQDAYDGGKALQDQWKTENRGGLTADKYASDLGTFADRLESALGALETKWQGTQDQIDELEGAIGDESQYTPESWKEVKDVLGQIDELNSKWSQSGHGGLTVDDYKSQLEGLLGKLQGAKDKLVKTEDDAVAQARKKLQDALDEMQDILGAGQCDYPDDVWEAFRNAYLAAKNPGPNPTVEKLEQLLGDLRKAREALVKPSTTDKKPQDQGGQKLPAGDNLPAVGSVHTVGKLVYQVKTSTAASKTVMVMKATSKTQKKITIPATVKIGGQAYKVVEIKANAFAKSKKLTTVKIGANVTKIGKKAFFKCAKLKSVNIKAKKLKTIGKNAFAKINKKATIKVPKKQKKTLQKKLKKAKTIKSAKIK